MVGHRLRPQASDKDMALSLPARFVTEPLSDYLWFEMNTGVILLRVVHAQEIEMSANCVFRL